MVKAYVDAKVKTEIIELGTELVDTEIMEMLQVK